MATKALTQGTHTNHTLPSEAFAIAAPTGIAAINVGGCTLHSLVGAGVPKVYGDFKKMWATRASWERMQILVIDEIGMAAASFLDAISSEIATMRGEYDKAFGGIQLVFCGDFGQLGPIEDEQASSGQQAAGEARPFVNTGLAFQARMWRAACFEVVRLNTVYRQDEKAFVDALNHLRDGNVPPEAVTLFGKTCAVPLHLRESASESASQSADLAVEATQLHAKNSAVDKVNTDRLQRLPGAVTVFVAIDTVQAGCATADPSRLPCLTNAERAALERSDFFKVCLAPQELQLKVAISLYRGGFNSIHVCVCVCVCVCVWCVRV